MVIQDDAAAGLAVVPDRLEGEQGVVDASDPVTDDNQDGQSDLSGEVSAGVSRGEGNEPPSDSLDEKGLSGGFEPVEDGGDCRGIEGSSFKTRGLDRGEGGAVGDRGDFARGEFVIRGGPKGNRVPGLPAGDRLHRDGVPSGLPEGVREQGGDIGLPRIGIGSGDEVVHGK